MSPEKNEKVLIVGTGAMACLFGARLSAVGITVTLLGTWKEAIQAIRRHGIRFTNSSGETQSFQVEVSDSPQDCEGHTNALVLVKSWQTARAAEMLLACLSTHGVALTLQNGLGNYEILQQRLGSKRVALGTTTIGATLTAPGEVKQAGEGVISIGVHPHASTLTKLLRRGGFILENVSDLNSLVWGKLIINAAINPLTALLEVCNGKLLEVEAAHELLKMAAREAAAVAMAQGIQLPYADPVVAAETIARRTAENRSSMLQDVLRGAPTEIDAINGAIVETGKHYGINTPVNFTLWKLVKAKTNSRL